MRRMYSESELRTFITNILISGNAVLNVDYITTRNLDINGDVQFKGDTFALINGALLVQSIQGTGGESNDTLFITGNVKVNPNYEDNGGHFTAKTLKQTHANAEFDFLDTLANLPSGLTYTKGYCKAQVIGNMMYVIFNYTLTNNTENQISAFNSLLNNIDVDEDIGSKIYNSNGENLNESTDSYSICGLKYQYGVSTVSLEELISDGNAYLRSSSVHNRLVLTIRANQALPAGASLKVSGRVFLSLL